MRNVVLLGAAAMQHGRPRPGERPEDPSKIQAGREDDTAPDTDLHGSQRANLNPIADVLQQSCCQSSEHF